SSCFVRTSISSACAWPRIDAGGWRPPRRFIGRAQRREAAMPDSSGDVPERRIAAIVLPELLIELASASSSETPARARKLPLGVVLCEPELSSEQKAGATAVLDAVSASARRYGVHPGQTIAEACVVVSNLVVRELAP